MKKILVCLLIYSTACFAQPSTNYGSIITLIDDDTLTPANVEAFHKACTDNGIVGTYACITSCGIKYPDIFKYLHNYEQEGFQVTLHCNEQKNYYRWTQNMDMTVTNVKQVSTGAKYIYVVGNRECPLTVEEIHLDGEGNGHIYFNFQRQWYPVPSSSSGQLSRLSGTGDPTIDYSDYQVREFRDNDLVNNDMNTALEIFEKEGFQDYNYFVSPYGSQDEGLQDIARSHGLKCLVSITNDDYLHNDNKYTPFNIPRIGFNATDAGGTSTFERLKEHMHALSITGGWLLVGTHIYNGWTEELINTRFKEFVDYAKDRGLRFVTLKEGFEIYSKNSGNSNFPYDSAGVVSPDTEPSILYGISYNLLGRRFSKLQHGLNIVRMSDGTTRMVIIK